MSFFLDDTPGVESSHRDYVMLHQLGCRACPLAKISANKHPDMVPTGAEHSLVYIMGDAPSKTDDEKGEHFVGEDGRLLRARIPRKFRDVVRFNNVVRSRPIKGATPDRISIECCRSSLINDLERTKPRAIIGLGNTPLEWVSGFTGITAWRGRRMPVRVGSHACWYYPLVHPASILHKQQISRQAAEDDLLIFGMDMRRVFADVEEDNLPTPDVHDLARARAGIETISGRGADDLDRLERVLEWAVGLLPVVGIDYETRGLRPYATNAVLLTAAVSDGERSVAFGIDHPGAGWSAKDKKHVRELWANFIRRARGVKVAHNESFELEWTGVQFGADLVRAGRWECTQVQASVIDERSRGTKPGPLSLDFLTQQYFGVSVKDAFPVDVTKLYDTPLEVVLRYNCPDARYAALLWREQKVEIERLGLEQVYDLSLRRVPTVVLSQMLGVPVDQGVVEELLNKYDVRIKKTLKQIAVLDVVKKYERLHGEYNPLSNQHAIKLMHGMLGRDECEIVDKKSKKSRLSVDESVLARIDIPLAKLTLDLRKATKMKSTYVEPLRVGAPTIYPDGLLHVNFNTMFAETGRLCVAGDTLLETSVGCVKIADLDLKGQHLGALIKTHGGQNKKIEKLWFKDYEPMLRLQFDNGSYIECTAGHRILTNVGWKSASEFKVGDYAITDSSFSAGSKSRNSVEGVRGCQQNYKTSPGKDICWFDALIRITCSAIKRVYWSARKNISSIKDVVGSSIWTCYSLCKGSQLCKRDVGKHAWCASSYPVVKSNRFAGMFNPWGNASLLGIGFGCVGVSVAAKYCLSRPIGFGSDATSFGGNYNARQGSDGDSTPWYVGRSAGLRCCKSLWRTARLYLFGLYRMHLAGRKDAICGYVRQTFTSRFMEALLTGNAACSGLTQTERGSCEAVAFWQEPARQSLVTGRFLYPIVERGYRGRWPAALEGSKGGSCSREDDYEEGSFGASSIHTPSTVSGADLYSPFKETARLESITPLGVQAVWDITVSGDHSYCAQGLIHHNSCDGPNLQNIPKRSEEGKEIRRAFGAPRNCTILAVDYGQIEARVIAMMTHDERFCKSLWERYDVHMEWARRVALAYPARVGGRKFLDDKKVMKDLRTDIKNQWTFPLFFGASLRTCSNYIKVPEDVLQPLYDEFWDQFSGVRDWQEQQMQFYREHGYVECASGRRRHGPLTMNMIINSPIQGSACEIVMDAMCRMSETGDPDLQPEINVHDDLTSMRVPEKRVDEVAEKMIDMMLDVPFEWAKVVPISVEMSVGKNWMQMQEVGTFSSDDWFKGDRK